jgi:hypothetical protein
VNYSIKISAIMFGVALAMTAACGVARNDQDSASSPRSGEQTAAPEPTQSVLREPIPAITVTCDDLGGVCETRSECTADQGRVINHPGCLTGDVCCMF